MSRDDDLELANRDLPEEKRRQLGAMFGIMTLGGQSLNPGWRITDPSEDRFRPDADTMTRFVHDPELLNEACHIWTEEASMLALSYRQIGWASSFDTLTQSLMAFGDQVGISLAHAWPFRCIATEFQFAEAWDVAPPHWIGSRENMWATFMLADGEVYRLAMAARLAIELEGWQKAPLSFLNRKASGRPDPFIPTQLQREIMESLDGRIMKTEVMAKMCPATNGNRTKLYGCGKRKGKGDLHELVRLGLVKLTPDGYCRPDKLPYSLPTYFAPKGTKAGQSPSTSMEQK